MEYFTIPEIEEQGVLVPVQIETALNLHILRNHYKCKYAYMHVLWIANSPSWQKLYVETLRDFSAEG